MEDIFKDDEFTQFILTRYFKDNDLSDEQKLDYIAQSVESFNDAVEVFKMTGKSGKH